MIDYSNAFVFSTCLLVVVFRNGIFKFSRTNFTLISFVISPPLERDIYFSSFINLEAVNFSFIDYHKLKASLG